MLHSSLVNLFLICECRRSNKLLSVRSVNKIVALSNSGGEEEESYWKSIDGLIRCPANYAALTPITFIDRSAKVFPDRTSVVYDDTTFTWSQTRQRCLKLASALSSTLAISPGHLVCFLFIYFSNNIYIYTHYGPTLGVGKRSRRSRSHVLDLYIL